MSIITHALVTGANGFIGSNLCAALLRQGIATRGLILPGTDAKEIAALGVQVVEADITKPLDAACFTGVSHVFHLAAIPLDWGPLAQMSPPSGAARTSRWFPNCWQADFGSPISNRPRVIGHSVTKPLRKVRQADAGRADSPPCRPSCSPSCPPKHRGAGSCCEG